MFLRSAFCFFAIATYIIRSIDAVELIVMEVVTFERSIPSKRISISERESIATPALPTSPSLMGSSLSYPICVGRSNATESPVVPDLIRNLYLSFDSSAVAKPAYWRIVQSLDLYIDL